MVDNKKLENVGSVLAQHGLVMHAFSFDELPETMQQSLTSVSNIQLNGSYLNLLANAGGKFWQTLVSIDATESVSKKGNYTNKDNPVDEASIAIAKRLLKIANQENNSVVLYPLNVNAPLIKLGQLANWSTPSPLGLGLHSEYGPWMAYRALIKTDKPLVEINKPLSDSAVESPCLTCDATPCVTACPANAVSTSESFNIKRCASHRISDNSDCNSTCHARLACPVGQAFKYGEEQLGYHMRHALPALRNWLGNKD